MGSSLVEVDEVANLSSLNDEDLVRAALARETSHDAFTEIYARYKDLVRRKLLDKFGVYGDRADDLVQETFTRAWGHLAQQREVNYLANWLKKIATNVAINARRKRRPTNMASLPPGEEYGVEQVSREREPRLRAISNEELKKLQTEVAGLTDLEQQMLTEFYFDGMSLEEMAKIPDHGTTNHYPPVGTIKSRLHNTRKKLLKKMES